MKHLLTALAVLFALTFTNAQSVHLNLGAGVGAQDGDFHVPVKVAASYQLGLDYRFKSNLQVGFSMNMSEGYISKGTSLEAYKDAQVFSADLMVGYRLPFYTFVQRPYVKEFAFTPVIGIGTTALNLNWGVHALAGARVDVDLNKNLELYGGLYGRILPENLDNYNGIYHDVSITAVVGVSFNLGNVKFMKRRKFAKRKKHYMHKPRFK